MKKSHTLYWHFPHLKLWMGGTKYLLDICQQLNKKGAFRVVVITNQSKSTIRHSFSQAGVLIKSVSRSSTNSLWYWFFFPLFLIADIYQTQRTITDKKAIFIATGFPSNVIMCVVSRIFHREYIYFCYDPFIFFYDQDLINAQPWYKKILLRILALLYVPLDKWATTQAVNVLTLDRFKGKEIQKIYGVNPHIVPVAVDTTFFKPFVTNRIAKQYKGRPLVIHSTDYTYLKRTDLAINAIAHLKSAYPNILLLITSTRPNSPDKTMYVRSVEQLGLENNIEFLNEVSAAELPLYYAASWCYLSTANDPLTATNLPVKEASACGVPVIRSNVSSDATL